MSRIVIDAEKCSKNFNNILDERIKSTGIDLKEEKYYVIAHPKLYTDLFGWKVPAGTYIGKILNECTEEVDYYYSYAQPECNFIIGTKPIPIEEKLIRLERDPRYNEKIIELNI